MIVNNILLTIYAERVVRGFFHYTDRILSWLFAASAIKCWWLPLNPLAC